ncbi:MAG: replication initiator [Egibacteraceae bacterium]
MRLVPRARCARWGTQIDLREIHAEERAKVAGYLAKYATKHTECVGGLDRRLKVEDPLNCPGAIHSTCCPSRSTSTGWS